MKPLPLTTEHRACHAIATALAKHADFYARHPELRASEEFKLAELRAGRAKVRFWSADDPFREKEINPIGIVASMIPRINRNTKGKRIPRK